MGKYLEFTAHSDFESLKEWLPYVLVKPIWANGWQNAEFCISTVDSRIPLFQQCSAMFVTSERNTFVCGNKVTATLRYKGCSLQSTWLLLEPRSDLRSKLRWWSYRKNSDLTVSVRRISSIEHSSKYAICHRAKEPCGFLSQNFSGAFYKFWPVGEFSRVQSPLLSGF